MIYGGGDIVFGEERSNQWMQWNSGIWWWGHCLWCKNVKPEDAVDADHSGIVVYGGVGTLFLVQKGQTSGCSGCSTQWNSGVWW